MTKTITQNNPLGTTPTHKLLQQFAIPSIIAMLVSSLYNIVDQIFIGQNVGSLGNAATNIAFPLSISCVAIALLFGIGGASTFNLTLGKGEPEKAVYYMGNSIIWMLICGVILCVVTQIFLSPLLVFFGSTEQILPLAKTYTRITSFGFPFLIIATGGGHLIRADGSPKFTMICNLTGAIINTILDALFVSVFKYGMAGAAVATIIGQIISALLAINYLRNCKTVSIKKKHLIPKLSLAKQIMSLGAAPCFNQVAMMIVQIVMNKSLKYYGQNSIYSVDIPIACVGIITKVNQIFMSFIIGLSQGLQPIVSFNYGAGNYKRVKCAYKQAVLIGFALSVFAFLIFQIFPHQITSLFGNGTDLYFQFAEKYFHIFLFFTFLNCFQPITSNYFTSIGKPKKGIFLSMTRQIIFLLPLILILPIFMGIDGIMYAGPIADFMAALACIILIIIEFRRPIYLNLTEV